MFEIIQKMKEKYSLLFDIYSISEEEVNKLKLNIFFPTNILIDRKGMIDKLFVGGQTTQEAADLFFKNQIVPNILNILK